MDLAERKRRMRREMEARRRAVPDAEAQAAARAVCATLVGLAAFRDAERVALYADLPGELPTRPLFEAVLRSGKGVCLPRIEGPDLAFARVARWEELSPGRYGVRQPPGDAPACPGAGLVLVPGLAFDAAGNRLGRGGGHYDRALGGGFAGGAMVIGLGYAFQLVEGVPHGPGDRPVHAVLTERGLLRAETP